MTIMQNIILGTGLVRFNTLSCNMNNYFLLIQNEILMESIDLFPAKWAVPIIAADAANIETDLWLEYSISNFMYFVQLYSLNLFKYIFFSLSMFYFFV